MNNNKFLRNLFYRNVCGQFRNYSEMGEAEDTGTRNYRIKVHSFLGSFYATFPAAYF